MLRKSMREICPVDYQRQFQWRRDKLLQVKLVHLPLVWQPGEWDVCIESGVWFGAVAHDQR